MLHIDIPTRADIEKLATARDLVSVSLYLRTSPRPTESDAARIELKNLASAAVDQLREAGVEKHLIESVQEHFEDLHEDSSFWRYQSHSLAIFVTPESMQTYRLPNELLSAVEVSDRFYIKPLLRTVTFPQAAFILAIAANSVRLIEISADSEPHEVGVQDMPADAPGAVGLDSISGRSTTGRVRGNMAVGRIHGSEGQKVRLRQYSRAVDRSLRPVLTGHNLPLIIAAAEPLASIYRSVNSYPNLVAAGINGNPEETSDADLAAAARRILDDLYAAELADLKETMAIRGAHGRAVTDLSDVARAATFGAVETLFVDIDRSVPGFVDEESGVITLSSEDNAANYGVVDEIVRRALLSDASIFAVRADDVPGGGAVAASVRFAV
ncbi:hypothetical protein GCM10022198_06920 [Klugiella xanthotipulae]|uniref:Peptide subunit release factor 1 (ERF1) n=1 Tax=Klugiella xanthotipulae TaxID=244735 RepID=A0A543HT63_9MICO|nr:hypothetical protein [Klugiella xanthotipulae]TQM61543.1 hypothetical protein FB466_2499 [Klugiella xanthotipulae]